MEHSLLAASLRSREDYLLIRGYIDLKVSTYSKSFQIVMSKVGDYYKRDGSVTSVDSAVLMAQLAESIRNEKHVELFSSFITESLAKDSSDANVRAVILLAKQQEVADKLSQVLATNSEDARVDTLIEELRVLRSMTSLEELTEIGLELYHDIDLVELISKESDPTNLIKIYPSSLNDRIDGGAKRGHHILVFAQVETGKSAMCINMNCGFARQGFKSIYFINEDRPQDIILRHISSLSGMTKRQIYEDPRQAQSLANDAGFQNIMVVSASPGTPAQIESYIDKYSPDCIIVDQLRNLSVKAESRVNQLEMAATAIRTISKRTNVLAVSVTQAGDSANNKLILEKGDVDFSNVGIPSQMDLMIGMGMDSTYEAEGLRHLTLVKNKLSGSHSNFPVRIDTTLSRIRTI